MDPNEIEEILESSVDDPNVDSEDDDEDENDKTPRIVIFGKIDLTVKAGLAHHWGVKLVECPHDPSCGGGGVDEETEDAAIRIAECLGREGVWYEVDGFQMDDLSNLKNNSINGSDDYTEPGEHCGVNSRLGSAPERVVGTTTMSDVNIYIFNKDYLAHNPKYSLLRNNCQNYADELCDFLCRSTDVLSTCGIILENVKDAMAKIYENTPEGFKDLIEKAEAAADDEDSALHGVVQKSKSGFNVLRSFKRDCKAKWRAKFGGGTAV